MKISGSATAGFSIIEVLVAFAILSIGMLGVGAMLTHSMKSDRYSERQRQSDILAASEIELIKSLSTDSELSNAKFNNKWASYRWNIDKDNPTSGMNRVEVEVGWGGSGNCLSDVDKCKYKTRIINYVIDSSS